MWTDVLDLNEFYSSTQGQMTVRLLRTRLREVWPNVRGETVLGLGYATPFLRPFREEAAPTLAFMPAQQGVPRWPREGADHPALRGRRGLRWSAGVRVAESRKKLCAGRPGRHTQPELAVVRTKLRIASSRDPQAARNAEDGEAPAS